MCRGARITKTVSLDCRLDCIFTQKRHMMCNREKKALRFKDSISMSLDSTCIKRLFSLVGRSPQQKLKCLSKQSFPEAPCQRGRRGGRRGAWKDLKYRNTHLYGQTDYHTTCNKIYLNIPPQIGLSWPNLAIVLTYTVPTKLLGTLQWHQLYLNHLFTLS